mgnify:FL=1
MRKTHEEASYRLASGLVSELMSPLKGKLESAVFDELKHRGYYKNQALHTILRLIEEPETIKEVLHQALDSYCSHLRYLRLMGESNAS